MTNNYHVVLGRLQEGTLEGNPDAEVEDVIELGPSTVPSGYTAWNRRQDTSRQQREQQLVTDPAGRLMGVLYLEDADRKLGVDAQ